MYDYDMRDTNNPPQDSGYEWHEHWNDSNVNYYVPFRGLFRIMASAVNGTDAERRRAWIP
jgi:hypothetical protein